MQSLVTIPVPVTYDMIKFYCPEEDAVVNYTDCWEISVYRFLHLVFSDAGKINFKRLDDYMQPKSYQSELLLDFFERYPVVHLDTGYYRTNKGLAERAEWAQMLNASKCLYLKRKKMQVVQIDEGGRYEVAATLENTFAFFEHFFPSLSFRAAENDRARCELLLEQLSRPGLELAVANFIEINTPSYRRHELAISVNGATVFEWEIYSYLRTVRDQFNNITRVIRTGGHSDYRFATETDYFGTLNYPDDAEDTEDSDRAKDDRDDDVARYDGEVDIDYKFDNDGEVEY